MNRYRGEKQHREAHPKIYVWSHTEKAEIQYFLEFKNYLRTALLMPKAMVCFTPWILIERVINWKNEKISSGDINEEDGDSVWCVFDVDSFYDSHYQEVANSVIRLAHDNNIKLAYVNECFETWILFHFEALNSAIARGKEVECRIKSAFKANGLRPYKKKNQNIFNEIIQFQQNALLNSKKILPHGYSKINWHNMLSIKGNPSTSIHLLVEEINKLKSRSI